MRLASFEKPKPQIRLETLPKSTTVELLFRYQICRVQELVLSSFKPEIGLEVLPKN